MRVYLGTLGCKLNESEIEEWGRQFGATGYEIVQDPALADLCVLNTCTVTSQAARKSRTAARHLARVNPAARIVLTGCYATMALAEASALPNVVQVVPNQDKDALVSLAGGLKEGFETLAAGCRLPEAASGALLSDLLVIPAAAQPHLRTRAFCKIQDGCNMSCTYCIIPLARGRERSRPPAEILAELTGLVDSGYQELILTGVQISDYSYEGDKRYGLAALVRRILAETRVLRLRLTSIAPWDLDDTLLDLFEDPRLCRHLHLSLQSGSDTVLRRMRRPYSTEQYARAVERARSRVPGVAITTDVIVGFPGESQVEFDQSAAFVSEMGLARVHVFPYSARGGTLAAGLPLQVSEPVKTERMRQMQAIAQASGRRFTDQFRGESLPVLWETQEPEPAQADDAPLWSGYTDNYIRVFARSRRDLQNRVLRATLIESHPEGAFGRLAVQ